MDIIKILVVDDEEEICELTRNFLRKRNYCTLGANTGQEAVDMVNKEKPQIVLLDVRLGEDSGLQVLRKIKEIDKNIKVIMVTALDDRDSINQARSLGADDYIAKPFTAGMLNDLILQKIAQLKIKVKNDSGENRNLD